MSVVSLTCLIRTVEYRSKITMRMSAPMMCRIVSVSVQYMVRRAHAGQEHIVHPDDSARRSSTYPEPCSHAGIRTVFVSFFREIAGLGHKAVPSAPLGLAAIRLGATCGFSGLQRRFGPGLPCKPSLTDVIGDHVCGVVMELAMISNLLRVRIQYVRCVFQ